MRSLFLILASLCFGGPSLCLAQTGLAPVLYTTAGSVYTQNFDGLPASGSFSLTGKGPFTLSEPPIRALNLGGWQLLMTAGSNANASFATGTGSSTGNGVYSLGNAGSTDRALGSLASGTGIYAFGLILTNQTGSILNSFTVSFTAEQWRKGGSSNKNTWTFRYKTGTMTQIADTGLIVEPRLDFNSLTSTSPASSLNGNLPDNRQRISVTLTGISWKKGEQLLLRWDDIDENGSDDVMAMDDLSFSADLNSGPPLLSDPNADSITSRSALLSVLADDHFQSTSLRLYYDTSLTFQNPTMLRPVPDTLPAGSGNTVITAKVNGLLSGRSYYYYFTAANLHGRDSSSIKSFTTTVEAPSVTTLAPSSITSSSAVWEGSVSDEGGAPVTDRGFTWKIVGNSTSEEQDIAMGSGLGDFSQTIRGLPSGKQIEVRAYAINNGGRSYGRVYTFVTPVTILSLGSSSNTRTNAHQVTFLLHTSHTISGLLTSHFAPVSETITEASITSIAGDTTRYTITVSTGKGDGILSIRFLHDSGTSVPIDNTPYTATTSYQIDKTPPQIRQIRVPDTPVKIGDTIRASLSVMPDTENFRLLSGTIAGFPLMDLTKLNDSCYTAYSIVTHNGKEVDAADSIPVMISLQDETGNTSVSQLGIHQSNDRIDARKPGILSVRHPSRGFYKTGDTLTFCIRFSETVWLRNGSPSLTLTIGTRSRPAIYVSGSGTDSLLLRYVIQPGDADADGIRTTSSLNMGNSLLTDAAGNTANSSFTNTLPEGSILVDAVLPVVTTVDPPIPNTYRTGDTLRFRISISKKVWADTSIAIPSIELTIGNRTRSATYVSGSGSNSLIFHYNIQRGDVDTNGIKLANTIIDSVFSLHDSIGNPMNPLLRNIGKLDSVFINPLKAHISGFQFPEERLYAAGDSLLFVVTYTDTVWIKPATTLPYLNLSTTSGSRKAIYVKGSGTQQLFFAYRVQPGDTDKTGIVLPAVISPGLAAITDKNDNAPPLNLPLSQTATRIKLDGIAPKFVSAGVDTIEVCGSSTPVPLSSYLTIADEEINDTLTWEIRSASRTAVITGTHFSVITKGKNIRPENIQYQASEPATGIDTLTVIVSDGINRSVKNILVRVTPVIRNNFITGPERICTSEPSPVLQGSFPEGGNGSYTFTWELSVLPDSKAFRQMNSLEQNSITPAFTGSSWFRRTVVSGACTSISASIRIIAVNNGLWLGKENNNWHQAGNWCGFMVPGSATVVHIYPGTAYQPQIRDTARCGDIFLHDNGTLSIEKVLRISGSINAGQQRIDARKATVVLQDTLQQRISGSSFFQNRIQQLQISNPGGVQLTDSLFISRELSLQKGVLHTGDQLQMLQGARIGASAAGTGLLGKLSTVQSITTGRRAFHLLGHPFTHSIGLSMIADSVDITGENGSQNGFTNSQTQAPSAFYYDPRKGNDSTGAETGWTAFTHTNGLAENNWAPMQGIRLLVRGKPGQGLDGIPAGDGTHGTYLPLPVNLHYTGNTHTGDQERSLQASPNGAYHVIGNPYLSNIDLSRTSRTSGVSRHYWLWHPSLGKQGGYSSYPFAMNHILPAFGAFMVETVAGTQQQILFTENSKSAEAASDAMTPVRIDDWYHIELRLESDSLLWDRLLLLQMDSARFGYDRNDASKLLNPDVNFYSLTYAGKQLSIDARPFTNESTIPLGLQCLQPGIFRIRVAAVNLPPSNTLMLHDKLLDKWTPLQQDSNYRFLVRMDTLTQGNDRFEVCSPKKQEDPWLLPQPIELTLYPVPVKDRLRIEYRAKEKGNTTVRILGISGRPIQNISLGTQKEGQAWIPLAGLIKGIYLLELRCGNYRYSKAFIKD
ncbi:MAG: T9SS type A sorting domain-containing protein [Bacteroidota bacterium]|nr:T9SS type A sorting domain-containing protein [Bacteroidota bacterium]